MSVIHRVIRGTVSYASVIRMRRTPISVRLGESGLRALDSIARHERKDRSTIIREILAEGIAARLKAAGEPK